MTFTAKFKEKAKCSTFRMELALKLGVSYFTIVRRLDNPNNDELTKPKYLKDLIEVSGIKENEIFEPE